jgi:hypothetical protein
MVVLVKHRHPKLSICLVEGLEINMPQGLTTSSFTLFYHNIHAHYTPNINTMQITYGIMMADLSSVILKGKKIWQRGDHIRFTTPFQSIKNG